MNQKIADYLKAKEYTDRVTPCNEIQQITYDRYEKIVNEFERNLPEGSEFAILRLSKLQIK